MEGWGCEVGGLVFGLLRSARAEESHTGNCEVEFHLRMLSLAPLPAGLRGVVDRRGIPQSFPSMDQTWLDICLFLWCWVAWVHGRVARCSGQESNSYISFCAISS
jgi:hypothetical protein